MAKSIYEILVQIEGNEQAQQALDGIGKAAGLTGAALVAFSGAAAKAAAGYETSLAAISTLATDATGTTKEFDEALYGLSQEMGGSIAVADAAAASYDILSSGYSNQADVLAILRESQKTAIGGFSDLATVSDASTTIMNAFGDALGENLSVTEKVKLVTDGMIATQDLGKITAGQYAAQIGNIASTAAAAGVSLQEINAAVSVATAQGVKVESTFAGLGQVLAAIMKPTSEAATKAQELGIQFDATALKTMGLQGVLQQLVDNGQATAENMTMLFGSVEAVKVLMPLVSNDAAAFNSALEQMANTAGTVDKAFETMSQTTEQRVQAALNQLENTFIKLGQGVIVAIEPAINALNFLVEKVASLPTPVLQAMGAIIALTGVTLTLAGAIALTTASIAGAMGGITAFVGALGAAKVAVTGFAAYNGITIASLGILAVQLGLVVAAVGAVATAFDALREKGTQFDENTQAIRDSIRQAREELAKFNNEQNIGSEADLEKISARRKWYDLFGAEQRKTQNDYRVNVRETRQSVLELTDTFRDLGNSQEATAQKQKLYQSGLKEIESAIGKLSEAELGTAVYEELRGELNSSKALLEQTAKAYNVTGQAATQAAAQTATVADATNQLAQAQAQANAEMAKIQSGNLSGVKMPTVNVTQNAQAPVLQAPQLDAVAANTQQSAQKIAEQVQAAQQNLAATQEVQALSQQQLQAQTGLSEVAKSYLQSQVNELQKLNTTALNMHASVRFISAQINGLPAKIAASMPRPTPTPVATR